MKNPFRIFKRDKSSPPLGSTSPAAVDEPAAELPEEEQGAPEPEVEETAPDDGFTEFCRTRVRGGIERRERNDIYEAYSVFGADREGRLTCRYYHRYPEHERDFGLSYSRALTFDEFNRRLLTELDRGDLKLDEYDMCISEAERVISPEAVSGGATSDYRGFSDSEAEALRTFCESMDIFTDRGYLHGSGVFSCECVSVVGGERLTLRFRKPLRHDAVDGEVPGVTRKKRAGYDIEDLWIMGIYNRLRDRCASCGVMLLTYEWSVNKESLWLFMCEGFEGVYGVLMAAVGPSDSFSRFGFYSLDFSNK